MRESFRKIILFGIALFAIALNVATFFSAYPQMFQAAADKARDFSAYYIGAWRLFFNPDKIYVGGAVPGDYPIYPKPASYKYSPEFLLLVSPLLVLDYQTAMVIFNLVQLLLLPPMAIMTYRLVRERSLILVSMLLLLVLLQPLPGADLFSQSYRLHSLGTLIHSPSISKVRDTFSWSYYRNWVDGNSKVLETFLRLGSFYFGKARKPYKAGLLFGLASFDPRWILLSIPLVAIYNRQSSRSFLTGLLLTVVLSNIVAVYHNIDIKFALSTLRAAQTPFYAYSWIPFYTIVGLTIVNYKAVLSLLREVVQSSRVRLQRTLGAPTKFTNSPAIKL